MPGITGLTLSPPGADAVLINISTSGLLAECLAPLRSGASIRVTFKGTFNPTVVDGQVARVSVASMTTKGVCYSVAIAFRAEIAEITRTVKNLAR